MTEFEPGDRVSWNTPQGRTQGVVKKRLTAATHVKDTKISASDESPRYLVESDRSGEQAAHKPDALRKI